jgi:tryptophanyl-tRNA synthetase
MTRYLSGIQPTGEPHLGNYFGAIVQHLEAARTNEPGESFFFIADYHALTSLSDKSTLQQNVSSVAASYISLGLDTERAVFFRQTDVPEVLELAWLLSTGTGMGLLERAHSYKDKVAKGISANVGLFTYPVLMAADILIYDSDIVPVGKDQVQHIEMTQDMAGYFNTRFGPKNPGPEDYLLKKPNWQLSRTPKVPGTDGQKMSSSYGNYIGLFAEGKALKKAVNGIVSDSRPPSEPKDPDGVAPYKILELFLSDAENKTWREAISSGGEDAPGYGDMKKEIMSRMNDTFGEARDKYKSFMENPAQARELEDILQEGAKTARKVAQSVLWRCNEACGFANTKNRLI